MLLLLFAVIFSEAMVVLSLLFKNPARKFLISGLDRFKRGRGPIIVKTVAFTVLTVLSSSIYSIFKIQKRWILDGNVNPTDQVLMSNHILEASLMAIFLFLALLTDRLHHYMRELRVTRKTVKDKAKFGGTDEIIAREEQVGSFKDIVRQLQSELDDKAKEVSSSNDVVRQLQSQLENKSKEVEYKSKEVENKSKEVENKTKEVEDKTKEVENKTKEVGSSKDTAGQLQSELGKKTDDMDASEAKVGALQKQLERLLVEYDRLLAENQELRARVVSS